MILRMVVGNSLKIEGNLSFVELEDWALHNTCFSQLLNSALAMCKSLGIPVCTAIQHLDKQEKKKKTTPKHNKGSEKMEEDQKVKVTILSLSHSWRTLLLAQAVWKCFPVKASHIAAASLAGKATLWWKQIPMFPWHWVAPATLQLSKNLSDSKEKLQLPLAVLLSLFKH